MISSKSASAAATPEARRRDSARAAKNAYMREWARKNPDKVRAAQERYWLKRAREMREEKRNAEQ